MNSNVTLLEVKNLNVSIDDNKILKNFNLKINKGEIHAIMGPNGSGKSTFSKVLAGHPAYSVWIFNCCDLPSSSSGLGQGSS